jgi:hypothetical protein
MEVRDFKDVDATLSFLDIARQQVFLQQQLHLLRDVFDRPQSAGDTPNVVEVTPVGVQREVT